jgi:hypothetical protein
LAERGKELNRNRNRIKLEVEVKQEPWESEIRKKEQEQELKQNQEQEQGQAGDAAETAPLGERGKLHVYGQKGSSYKWRTNRTMG